ncbi:MAG TPA: peptidase E [Gaiellaceae bacterium]|nr:peptidase E [Gaiellaceae bacterium]
MANPTVVGIGGFPDDPLLDYVLGLARGPRLLYVGTAAMEDPATTLELVGRLHGRAEVSDLTFRPWPPPDLRAFALEHDVILVGGGSTANMLAVWRVHGFDEVLREAWREGVVLTGWSAGMICWFEAGVTDSFGPQLEGMRDGLGLLPGSACPHYDGEDRRRPVYRELVAGGFPAGIALDDAAAARYDGTELVEVVSSSPGARGYRVSADGEEPIEARPI